MNTVGPIVYAARHLETAKEMHAAFVEAEPCLTATVAL